MEPGHEDREYGPAADSEFPRLEASMEPGHEDREYRGFCVPRNPPPEKPQWSPVMKTGNTRGHTKRKDPGDEASMEPGHEDREYAAADALGDWNGVASMEPGHEDREYAETP